MELGKKINEVWKVKGKGERVRNLREKRRVTRRGKKRETRRGKKRETVVQVHINQ